MQTLETMDYNHIVMLTFVPAISISDEDGSIDEPTVMIYTDETNTNYAFPFLTDRIREIYDNIMAPYINYELEYTPEKVTIIVPIMDWDEVDALRDQTNWDVTEGEGWGDLTLDEETAQLVNLDLEAGEDILYIPFLNDVQVSEIPPLNNNMF